MYKQEVTVVNPTGLHARPAAEFCKIASQFNSEIRIERLTDTPKEGNAKSVITIMSMGLSKDTPVAISAEGADEVAAVDELVALIQSGFGEL